MFCDDNAFWIELICLALENESQFKVVAQASNGRETIEQIEIHRPDIIILDIVMPEYDGVYIVSHVRKSMRGYSPIVYVLSGFGAYPVVKELSELGVDFFSMKPVAVEVIVSTIKTLVKYRDNPDQPDHSAEEENARQDVLEAGIKDILLRLGIMSITHLPNA